MGREGKEDSLDLSKMNSDVFMLVNRNGGDCIRNVLLAAEEIYSISVLCWSPIYFKLSIMLS